MKNLWFAVAFFAVAIINACETSPDSSPGSTQPDAREAIDSSHKAFLEAMRANDADALAVLLTPDAVFMPPNDSSRTGREGVRTWYKGILSQFKTKDVSVTDREVTIAGEWGIERANFTWTLTPVAGGTEIINKGKFIAIWHKEPDGNWKAKYDIWNSSIPPPQ